MAGGGQGWGAFRRRRTDDRGQKLRQCRISYPPSVVRHLASVPPHPARFARHPPRRSLRKADASRRRSWRSRRRPKAAFWGEGKMSVGFRAVQWNRRKVVYDLVLLAGVALYVAAFMGISAWRNPPADWPDWINLRIDAFGSCAFVMLTIILSIGPLTRLDPRFLPLLYNRRHFGVLTFFVAAVHGWSVVEWFLALDALPNLANELTNTTTYGKFIGFPYKALGIAALVVLLLLAATSHDFWLAFLTPPVWKALHMLLYLAYGVVVMHVALGAMQQNRSPLFPLLIGGGFVWVAGLHLVAGWRERHRDRGSKLGEGGWI